MSGSTGLSGNNATRYSIRSVAVLLLVLGFAAASGVSATVDTRSGAAAEAASALDSTANVEAYQLEIMRLQRLAEASERADRKRRIGPSVTERVSRAEPARSRPAPSPEPAPAPAPAPSNPAPSAPSTPSNPAGPVPESCESYSGNRAIGCTLLLEAGFGIDQMSCLDNLWTRESGWNHLAQNPSSGAYGIPQALPGSKMASHGDDWQTNPATQIRWGLSYISGRYGTPCGAWQFFQNNGWY